jgi:hypothetical protein
MGQINWRWHDGPAVVGRTNVMSESAGVAGNRSCPACNCTPFSVTFSFPAGDQMLSAGGTFTYQIQETDRGCDGSPTFNTPGRFGLSWSSSNPQVATVDGAGNVTAVSAGTTTISTSGTVDRQTTPVGTFPCGFTGCHESPCGIVAFPVSAQAQVTVKPRIDSISPAKGLIGATISGVTISGRGLNGATVNAGTGITATVKSSNDTTITVDLAVASNATAGNHSISVSAGGQTSNSANFSVQVPTFFDPQSFTSVSNACGGSFPFGVGTIVHYRLTDQNHSTIGVAGITPRENITDHGVQSGFRPFSNTTSLSGTFDDNILENCSATPPPPNQCASSSQAFDVLSPLSGGGTAEFPIKTTTSLRLCTQGDSVTVNANDGKTAPVNFTFGTVN